MVVVAAARRVRVCVTVKRRTHDWNARGGRRAYRERCSVGGPHVGSALHRDAWGMQPIGSLHADASRRTSGTAGGWRLLEVAECEQHCDHHRRGEH
eukprot:4698754-Prymnesium_polylepis.1